jgi:hypothetical protein
MTCAGGVQVARPSHQTGRGGSTPTSALWSRRVAWGLFAEKIIPMHRRELIGMDREEAIKKLVANHYAHSFPSGKSHIFEIDGAIIVFSIPANNNLAKFVLGREGIVWELSRMWAPDNHARNLLTRAISEGVALLRRVEPKVEALISYADPNVGHAGGVYRAASWIYKGQSDEGRYYRSASGQVVARRKFHSGSKFLRKAEILALGYVEHKLPGKHRFIKGITKRASKDIARKWSAV